MVAGATAGKTKVSSTQSRLAVAGGAQDAKVAAAIANVRANVDRQLKCADEGGGAHCIKCPVKALFELQLSEESGQEKNKCLLCDEVVRDNFSKRLMHLLGNDRNGVLQQRLTAWTHSNRLLVQSRSVDIGSSVV
jgi:hypothetical protein